MLSQLEVFEGLVCLFGYKALNLGLYSERQAVIGKPPALGVLGKSFTAEPLGSLRSGLAVSGSCIGFSLCLEESLLEGILLPPIHRSFRLSSPPSSASAYFPWLALGFVWLASFGFTRQVFSL